jgi:hypothetical protein
MQTQWQAVSHKFTEEPAYDDYEWPEWVHAEEAKETKEQKLAEESKEKAGSVTFEQLKEYDKLVI